MCTREERHGGILQYDVRDKHDPPVRWGLVFCVYGTDGAYLPSWVVERGYTAADVQRE